MAESISAKQIEGGKALGMSRWDVLTIVVLPQALVRVIPPLANQLIVIIKDTSLVSAIAVAELTQVVQRQVVAAQVEQRVEKHGGMPRREDEPVAVGPLRVTWAVPQVPCPEHVREGRERDRGARVPRIGRLDRVHGQSADRIDAEAVESRRTRFRDGHSAPGGRLGKEAR